MNTHQESNVPPVAVNALVNDLVDDTMEKVEKKADLFEFEGQRVTKTSARMKGITVPSADAYRQGDIVRMAVEMRVGKVEFKDNDDGTLTRVHEFHFESMEVVSSFRPEDQILPGGSSSSTAEQTPDDADELGLPIRRTGQDWPDNVAQMPMREAQ